jgi:superfamily II DNA helicase RecQ
VHLLNTWGASFRKDFLQMRFVHARMSSSHNPWILASATVRDGAPFQNICRLLGLDQADFHLIRRSSARPDVRLLFRDLISPISGDSFPNWIGSWKKTDLQSYSQKPSPSYLESTHTCAENPSPRILTELECIIP